MSLTSYWQQVCSTALLGTDRQALPPVEGTPLESLLVPSEDKETTLLNAAALVSLYIRSGQSLKPSSHSPLEPAPPLMIPADSTEGRILFEQIAQKGDLWREWLDLSIKYQVPPPPGTLHKLLELGKSASLLRPQISQVIGPRGHWLAKFLEVSWITPEDLADALWEEGNLKERIAYLTQVRAEAPEQARTMLEAIWKQENAEARTGLLEVFKAKVSLSDEAFLENCLDDKSKRVKELAAEILSSLPGSQFTKRMIERSKPFLNYKPGGLLGLKKASLEVHLPEAYDKSWARDGIEQKGMPYGMGEKAWWLKQMLERVPPSVWGNPEVLSVANKEWRDLLRGAFQAATLTFADTTWARYFLPDEAMLRLLPLEERYDYVSNQLSNMQGPVSSSDTVWTLLMDLPKPWKPGLEEALLKRAQLSLLNWSRMQQGSWREQHSLVAFGQMLPVSFHETLPKAIAEKYAAPDHPLREAFHKMMTLLELRKRMYTYFGEKTEG